jgi:hypothetical protein
LSLIFANRQKTDMNNPTGCHGQYPNCRLHCPSPQAHRAMFVALTTTKRISSAPPARSPKIDYDKLQLLMNEMEEQK